MKTEWMNVFFGRKQVSKWNNYVKRCQTIEAKRVLARFAHDLCTTVGAFNERGTLGTSFDVVKIEQQTRRRSGRYFVAFFEKFLVAFAVATRRHRHLIQIGYPFFKTIWAKFIFTLDKQIKKIYNKKFISLRFWYC